MGRTMEVKETPLPGVGKRVEFRGLSGGHSLAIVIFEDGRKELYVNPDDPKPIVVKLDAEEARLVGNAIFAEARPKTVIDHISRTFQGGMAMDQFTITDRSPVSGHTIRETRLRSESGASIIALIRGGKNLYNPAPETAVASGDVLVLIGDEEQLHRARRIITGETKDA